MELSAYVAAVSDDLTRMAALGDEHVAHAAELLASALEPSLGRRLQEALAEAALELSSQLDYGSVEVRMAGSDPQLVYVDEAGPAEPREEMFSARITLRLPETLKSRLEAAAASGGLSVNTWLVQALSRMVEPRQPAGGPRRLTGYGRS